jgi:3-mercaptopyruvate sulfurtransferase SseA
MAMGRDSLYIDLNDWVNDNHPEMTKSRIEMIRSVLEELKIEEDEEVIITGDYRTWGLFCNYLITRADIGGEL